MVDIVRMLVAESDGVAVHVIDHDITADANHISMADDDISEDIPTAKCYKNKNYRQKILGNMIPISSVSDQQRYFDINKKIAQLHGSCISDSDNHPISPMEFRSANPDMQFWLNTPQVSAITENLPMLGLHIELQHLPAAHDMAMKLFKDSVLQWPANDKLFGLVREHFHVKCMLSGMNLKKGNHVILLELLSDELSLHWSTLIEKITSKLTIEIMEHYGNRNAVLASEITQLIDTSSYKRVAKRRVPDQVELFCTTLKMKLFTELEQQLNNVILQVVKNAK